MEEAFNQIGETARHALESDERTARLVQLMIVAMIGMIVYGIMF